MRSAGAGRAIPLLRLFTLSNTVERLLLVIFKVNLEATIAFIQSGNIYIPNIPAIGSIWAVLEKKL